MRRQPALSSAIRRPTIEHYPPPVRGTYGPYYNVEGDHLLHLTRKASSDRERFTRIGAGARALKRHTRISLRRHVIRTAPPGVAVACEEARAHG